MKPVWLVAVAIFAQLAGRAAAQPMPVHAPQDCGRSANGNDWIDMPCILKQAGSLPAEAHVRAGGALIRLIDWDAWGRLRILLEFTRDKGGAVRVHIARINAGEPDIVQTATASIWRDAVAALARYRDAAVHPPKPPQDKNGMQTVCVTADGWGERVETALQGRVEYIRGGDVDTGNMCFDPMDDLSERLRALAVLAVPYCSKIGWTETAMQIEACLLLDGDKMAAAEIYSRAERFQYQYCHQPHPADILSPVFAAAATVTVAGGASASGPDAAARTWLDLQCKQGDSMFVQAVNGASGSVTGILLRSRHDETNRRFDARADFTQRWVREPDGQFRVTEWRIGPFVERETNVGRAAPTQ